jgi:hypothetical protein
MFSGECYIYFLESIINFTYFYLTIYNYFSAHKLHSSTTLDSSNCDVVIPFKAQYSSYKLLKFSYFCFVIIFQGKFCHQDLVIHSSFRVKMSIWEVTFSPTDSRFYYMPSEEFSVALTPYKDTEVCCDVLCNF